MSASVAKGKAAAAASSSSSSGYPTPSEMGMSVVSKAKWGSTDINIEYLLLIDDLSKFFDEGDTKRATQQENVRNYMSTYLIDAFTTFLNDKYKEISPGGLTMTQTESVIQHIKNGMKETVDMLEELEQTAQYTSFCSHFMGKMDGTDARGILELQKTDPQCNNTVGSLSKKQFLPCWICGRPFVKEPPTPQQRKKDEYFSPQCEHILPVTDALFHLNLYQIATSLLDYDVYDQQLINLEYRWAHACCNMAKKERKFIKANMDSGEYEIATERDEGIDGTFEQMHKWRGYSNNPTFAASLKIFSNSYNNDRRAFRDKSDPKASYDCQKMFPLSETGKREFEKRTLAHITPVIEPIIGTINNHIKFIQDRGKIAKADALLVYQYVTYIRFMGRITGDGMIAAFKKHFFKLGKDDEETKKLKDKAVDKTLKSKVIAKTKDIPEEVDEENKKLGKKIKKLNEKSDVIETKKMMGATITAVSKKVTLGGQYGGARGFQCTAFIGNDRCDNEQMKDIPFCWKHRKQASSSAAASEDNESEDNESEDNESEPNAVASMSTEDLISQLESRLESLNSRRTTSSGAAARTSNDVESEKLIRYIRVLKGENQSNENQSNENQSNESARSGKNAAKPSQRPLGRLRLFNAAVLKGVLDSINKKSAYYTRLQARLQQKENMIQEINRINSQKYVSDEEFGEEVRIDLKDIIDMVTANQEIDDDYWENSHQEELQEKQAAKRQKAIGKKVISGLSEKDDEKSNYIAGNMLFWNKAHGRLYTAPPAGGSFPKGGGEPESLPSLPGHPDTLLNPYAAIQNDFITELSFMLLLAYHSAYIQKTGKTSITADEYMGTPNILAQALHHAGYEGQQLERFRNLLRKDKQTPVNTPSLGNFFQSVNSATPVHSSNRTSNQNKTRPIEITSMPPNQRQTQITVIPQLQQQITSMNQMKHTSNNNKKIPIEITSMLNPTRKSKQYNTRRIKPTSTSRNQLLQNQITSNPHVHNRHMRRTARRLRNIGGRITRRKKRFNRTRK
jgi:hypothetical protein